MERAVDNQIAADNESSPLIECAINIKGQIFTISRTT